ncbi:MAG TPA: hypothetical protein VLK25_13095 [Allosphingosinicella sp.]|nr:hypothetical protein [Allosphingosinicella sp.]
MREFTILAMGWLALAAMPAAAVPAQPDKTGAGSALQANSVPLSRQFMIGTWTDDGDCDHAVEFLGDGRYFAGGSRGIWQLDGHELTLTSDAILVMQVVPLDEDTIGVIGADGSVGESMRCMQESLPLPGPDETV